MGPVSNSSCPYKGTERPMRGEGHVEMEAELPQTEEHPGTGRNF